MRLLLIVIFLAVLSPVTGFSAEWLVERLDNGLTVLILENHQVPQVNISTAIGVGAKNESDYFDGATHFLEHLILFRGTEEMTGEELGNAMKRHGAYFNGFTSSDWTDFLISLPKENLDFGLKIHADMLFRSNFPEEEMDKERHAVLEEINITEDNPFLKGYRSSLKELYGSHPYSKNVLGTKENIRSVSRDSMYAYYKRYYAPNNMTLAVVGDFDAAGTLEIVKKYFGAFPRGADPVDKYSLPPKVDTVREIRIVKDVSQAYLLMGMLGPKVDSPDQFTVDIMANLLGGGQSSRLWRKLKDEMGLAYSVQFPFYTSKYEGMMFTFATVDTENIPAVEKAANEVLEDVKKNGFTEQELRKAKNSIKTNFFLSTEEGLDMANQMVQYNSHIGYQFVLDYPDNIEKVTLAELNTAARKYLDTDSYVKTMVVPR